MHKLFLLFPSLMLFGFTGFAQTSDDAFRQPLKAVLADIEKQYGITLRYPEDIVKDRWITYAGWRFRPDVETTLKNILSSQDISFAKEGEKKYKLQQFQYHLKTVEEGKEQMQHISSLFNDVQSWEKRKGVLKRCMISTMKLSNIPAAPASKPIITTVRKYDGYTVENIAIETLPGLYVSGSLYRPLKAKGKLPLVLNPDGHFVNGRYREDCQLRCATLARMGALAFSYDLFGWDGESRLQVKPEDHRRALVQSIQALHAIRLLDYLLSLKEVDTNRVAITGASGGGSQSMLMAAIDDRIKISVPVVMLSSYHSGGCPCESGMGTHLCGGGTNNVEIAAMAAPRLQLIVSDGKDWTQNVPQNEFPFLQMIYGFYGTSDNVKNVHLPAEGHDYGTSKRKAMYDFIGQHFGLNMKGVKDKAGNYDESRVIIEKEASLLVFGEKGERLPAHALRNFDEVVNTFKQAMQ